MGRRIFGFFERISNIIRSYGASVGERSRVKSDIERRSADYCTLSDNGNRLIRLVEFIKSVINQAENLNVCRHGGCERVEHIGF